MERLIGTYHLDFEPAATCSIELERGLLRVLTPDGEYVELVAHLSNWFSGDSEWGKVILVFEK